MNLEQAISELIYAIRDNTAAIRAGYGDTPPPPAAEEKPAAIAERVAEDEPAPLTYEKDVRPVAVKLAAAKGRDALVKCLGLFGASKAPELKPEDYATFINEANAIAGA